MLHRLGVAALLLGGALDAAMPLADGDRSSGSSYGMGREPSARVGGRNTQALDGASVERDVVRSPDSSLLESRPSEPLGSIGRETSARSPLNQPGCTICLTGSANVQWNGSTGSFHVDAIQNNGGSGTSGSLDLRIALTVNSPVFGQPLSYQTFSDVVPFSPLPAGYQYSPVNSGTIGFYGSSIPPGDYFQLLYLREYQGGGKYAYNDWVLFSNKVHCDGFGCSTIAAPTANFTFSANPKAGQAVQFTDTSTGAPTSWSWNFGDNGTSTSQNPSHTYASAGTYQVSLTASNSGGPNTKTQTIVVSAAGGGGGGTTCTEDANTVCLIGGRYKVTGRWKNQYAGGAAANLFKSKLTDTTNAFYLYDPGTFEFMIRVNTVTDNGRAWITILTFTSVEFWVDVTDTKTGQFKEYHSDPGNLTLIYDPTFFVYP